ncbi:MAG: hypothetical protein ACR2OV_05430 [Hyphomicrobiaceae bacterium]
MSDTTAAGPRRVTLAEFLGSLDGEVAAHVKAAAAAIDDLERRAQPVRGIERRLAPVLFASAIAFVLGLTLFFAGKNALFGSFSWIDNLGITLLLGGLPILGFYYAFRVRWRTRADTRSFELNQTHFIPHGGIYFAATNPSETASVVLIDPTQGWKPKPSKYDKLKPGWMW